MLKATEQIINVILNDGKVSQLRTLIDIVCRHGSHTDAKALYNVFNDCRLPGLLDPVMLHGDQAIADDLFKRAVINNAYPECLSSVLAALGYMQHLPTLPVLMEHYDNVFNLDWDLHEAVSVALLNYDCRGYESRIKKQVEKCLDMYLFPDSIPLLAVKTGDRSLIDKMYRHGNEECSTSCCGGLIGGIAFFGGDVRQLFKSIIFNPGWEATYPSIGNLFFTTMGMDYLNISIKELYDDLLSIMATKDDARYEIFAFADVLSQKIDKADYYAINWLKSKPESYLSIYEELFAWKDDPNKDETIVGQIDDYCRNRKKDNEFNTYYNIRDKFELKVEQELERLYTPLITT